MLTVSENLECIIPIQVDIKTTKNYPGSEDCKRKNMPYLKNSGEPLVIEIRTFCLASMRVPRQDAS